ncbi:MAG: TIGR00730 family Rossman fold protein [Pirellulales bacterium]|nr:TIGR00730 family Rossman fold protein [Pirellulales bacterium]
MARKTDSKTTSPNQVSWAGEALPAHHDVTRRTANTPLPAKDVDVAANRQAILQSPSYRLAEVDIDFLSRKENRPLRMQLELLKTETLLREHKIESTVVVFGGTQIMPCEQAEAVLNEAKLNAERSPHDARVRRALRRAEQIVAKSHFYEEAREFSRLVSSAEPMDGRPKLVVMTGGGPGVMEAANRGAFEVGAKSVGLNIDLPHEQEPNPYITPDLCFQFHYFAMRKFHFVLRAAALVVFPGGFGTLDELFDCLCLRQTRRMQQIPIILYGRSYWDGVINFKFLTDEGVIDDDDLQLISYAETPRQAWDIIAQFHGFSAAP